MLGGVGPYTIFAPADAAFDGVPAALRDSLAQAENAAQLRSVVAGHVVAGKITAADLSAGILAGGGSYEVATLGGGTLTFRAEGESVRVSGGSGAGALVTMADLTQANGTMHVIDGVLLPAS